jgi:hypothetical protein
LDNNRRIVLLLLLLVTPPIVLDLRSGSTLGLLKAVLTSIPVAVPAAENRASQKCHREKKQMSENVSTLAS